MNDLYERPGQLYLSHFDQKERQEGLTFYAYKKDFEETNQEFIDRQKRAMQKKQDQRLNEVIYQTNLNQTDNDERLYIQGKISKQELADRLAAQKLKDALTADRISQARSKEQKKADDDQDQRQVLQNLYQTIDFLVPQKEKKVTSYNQTKAFDLEDKFENVFERHKPFLERIK